MDQQQLTAWKFALSSVPCRRTVLRGLAGAGLGLGGLPLLEIAAAKKKNNRNKRKKKRKKKPQPVVNQYGCLDVGQPCRGNSALCCSGICQGVTPQKGKKDTSRCVAHDTGTCQQSGPGICTSDAPHNVSCNNNGRCRCISTTAGSNVCAALLPPPEMCASCQRDTDCIALGFPAGSACAPFSEGFCGGACSSGMVCLTPCGAVPPGP